MSLTGTIKEGTVTVSGTLKWELTGETTPPVPPSRVPVLTTVSPPGDIIPQKGLSLFNGLVTPKSDTTWEVSTYFPCAVDWMFIEEPMVAQSAPPADKDNVISAARIDVRKIVESLGGKRFDVVYFNPTFVDHSKLIIQAMFRIAFETLSLGGRFYFPLGLIMEIFTRRKIKTYEASVAEVQMPGGISLEAMTVSSEDLTEMLSSRVQDPVAVLERYEDQGLMVIRRSMYEPKYQLVGLSKEFLAYANLFISGFVVTDPGLGVSVLTKTSIIPHSALTIGDRVPIIESVLPLNTGLVVIPNMHDAWLLDTKFNYIIVSPGDLENLELEELGNVLGEMARFIRGKLSTNGILYLVDLQSKFNTETFVQALISLGFSPPTIENSVVPTQSLVRVE